MRYLLTILLLSLGLLAQQPKDKPSPSPTGVSTGTAFVGLEPSDEIDMLRLEKQSQQIASQINALYAQSQKALVDMSEAQRQKQSKDKEIQDRATAIATRMKIDTAGYDFDADQNKFTKKKKP